MAVSIILIAVILAADQLSKFAISRLLYPAGASLPIIKNVFHLTLVHNTGVAFGLFKNQTYFFIIITLIAAATILILLKKIRENSLLKITLSLIIAGALGNLIDRIRFGYVIDFLDFRVWPVFNLADSSITIGVVILAFKLLLTTKN